MPTQKPSDRDHVSTRSFRPLLLAEVSATINKHSYLYGKYEAKEQTNHSEFFSNTSLVSHNGIISTFQYFFTLVIVAPLTQTW